MILRIATSLGLFLGSMAVGYVLGRRGWLNELRASRIVRWLVTGPSPVILCLSFWRMDLRSFEPWVLPLIGCLVSVSTLIPAYWIAQRMRMAPAQTGSFLNCAVFSNVGFLGAFTAFALWGEAAYALCAVYFIFFTPLFYTLGFTLASRFGQGRSQAGLGKAFHPELRLYPFLGMAAGAALSLSGIPRPPVFEQVNGVLIPLETGLYLMSIGSQVHLTSPRLFLRPCLAMAGIKFIYSPLVALALLELFQIRGFTRTIVLLEAATPVGVSPLVLPLLFGLDRRLTNALWLSTTFWSLPYLALLLPVLWHARL